MKATTSTKPTTEITMNTTIETLKRSWHQDRDHDKYHNIDENHNWDHNKNHNIDESHNLDHNEIHNWDNNENCNFDEKPRHCKNLGCKCKEGVPLVLSAAHPVIRALLYYH